MVQYFHKIYVWSIKQLKILTNMCHMLLLRFANFDLRLGSWRFDILQWDSSQGLRFSIQVQILRCKDLRFEAEILF